jgi:hypothetical protein
LTPDLVAEVEQLAAQVEYMETLAAFLGIDRSTLYRWLKRGSLEENRRARGRKPKEGEDLFVEFCRALKKGRAISEKRSLDTIRAAADAGQWQAAAWRLERAYPQRWSLQKQEIARLRKAVKKMAEQLHLDHEKLAE